LHYFISCTMPMGSRPDINIFTLDKIVYQKFLFDKSFLLQISVSFPHAILFRGHSKHTETLINHETHQKQIRVRRIILAATEKCPVSDTPELPFTLLSAMNTLWDQAWILRKIRGECYVRSAVNIAYQEWIIYVIRSEYCMRSGVNIMWDQAW